MENRGTMTTYDTEENFNRILLYKPQKDLTYIRKLSMSYGYYVALACVDKNNKVTHVGVSNSFQIIPFNKLNTHDRNILGSERCLKLEADDLMSVYRIKKYIKLNKPYKLLKDCRGMRFTLPEENYQIKKEIINTLHAPDNGVVNMDDNGSYEDIYNEYVELDIENINLDDEIIIEELDNFNKTGATGQTKLL